MSEGYSKSNLSIRKIFKKYHLFRRKSYLYLQLKNRLKSVSNGGRNCHFFDGYIDTFFENLKAKRIFRRQISQWQNLNILAVNIQILNIPTLNTHDPIVPAPIVANHEHDPNILMITLNRLSNKDFEYF